MKVISFSSEPTLMSERFPDRTVISTTGYVVQFTFDDGDVDIRLRGNVAGQMQRIIDNIPAGDDVEKRVKAALEFLTGIGRDLT